MTRKPDDTEPTGAPDAAIDSLLDDPGAIDIRADQAASDGLEQARYYAAARPVQPRTHTKTDPLSNIIVEKTPRPPLDGATEPPRAPTSPASASRDLVPTEISLHRAPPREVSTARRVVAVFLGAAVMALLLTGVALVVRSAKGPGRDETTPTSTAAPSIETTTKATATTPPSSTAPTATPSTSDTPPRAPASVRTTPSVREQHPPTPASAATPAPPPTVSSPPQPAPSASVRFGQFVQEDVK